MVYAEGKYSLISTDGKTIIPEKYEQLWAVAGNFYKVKQGDKYLILKPNGQVLNETQYNEINTPEFPISTPDWPCIVKEKSKYGLLANNGFYLLPMQYKNILYIGNNLYKIKENKKWGLINANGQALSELIYSNIEFFENDFILVEIDGKLGLLNKQGKMIAEVIYDKIEKDSNKIKGMKANKIQILVNIGLK